MWRMSQPMVTCLQTSVLLGYTRLSRIALATDSYSELSHKRLKDMGTDNYSELSHKRLKAIGVLKRKRQKDNNNKEKRDPKCIGHLTLLFYFA